MLAQMIKHGGFQAAEAEIERITARFRGAEFHGSGRSVCCGSQPIENRAPGVTEREEFRDFVISLARRIVARLPQLAVTKKRAGIRHTGTLRIHFIQNRVSARDNQTNRGKIRSAPRFVRLEKNGVDMPFQMIDRHQWLAQRFRQRLAISDSHEKGADKAWPLRHADGVNFFQLQACLRKRFAHHRHNLPQMLARSQFRDHAAIFPVYVDLRGHDAGQNLAPVRDHGGRGLVTRRFNS